MGVTMRSLLHILQECWASRWAPKRWSLRHRGALHEDPEGVLGVTVRSLKILKKFWARRALTPDLEELWASKCAP